MTPLFSATNTRPLGANSIAIGVSRPAQGWVVCWNPGGSVTAAAGATGHSSATAHAASKQRMST
jgi:hypothetical protein